MKILALSFLVSLFYNTFQTDNPPFEWKKDLEVMLHEFMSCGPNTPANTPCNIYLAKALERVYGIGDFKKASGQYLTANEISSYVKVHTDTWTNLGSADSQKTLDESQGYANLKKAVIAVYEAPVGSGHVALIIPGYTTTSGSWKLKCPNSSSFFINHPEKSYISQSLSMAFPSTIKSQVIIYGRNF